jgi:hypothetical protein
MNSERLKELSEGVGVNAAFSRPVARSKRKIRVAR